MKLVVRSCFPFSPGPARLVPAVLLGALSVAAVLYRMPVIGSALGVLAAVSLLMEADRAVPWRCPHCWRRSLRVVGTGGLWYTGRDDFREERVFWGECAACGRRATRKGLWPVPWKAHPPAEPGVAPAR